jgi:hypothetical protein
MPSLPLASRHSKVYSYLTRALSLSLSQGDRQPPSGYNLGVVSFGADGEPVEPSTSNTAALSVFGNADNTKCPASCFRPVGLALDAKGRIFMSSDASGEIFVVQKSEGESRRSFSTPPYYLPYLHCLLYPPARLRETLPSKHCLTALRCMSRLGLLLSLSFLPVVSCMLYPNLELYLSLVSKRCVADPRNATAVTTTTASASGTFATPTGGSAASTSSASSGNSARTSDTRIGVGVGCLLAAVTIVLFQS